QRARRRTAGHRARGTSTLGSNGGAQRAPAWFRARALWSAARGRVRLVRRSQSRLAARHAGASAADAICPFPFGTTTRRPALARLGVRRVSGRARGETRGAAPAPPVDPTLARTFRLCPE